MWEDYLFPSSIEEALAMLVEKRGGARIIAGGTDLVLQCRRGQCSQRIMVDITRIPGLDFIKEQAGFIYIGCQATHSQIASSPLIQARAAILAEACAAVGGPQIRHVGTLVGNVVNALPAADGAVALLALGAEAELITRDETCWQSVARLYAGVGRSFVDPCSSLVRQIRFPSLCRGESGAFERLARRKALVLPTLVVAAVLGMIDGKIVRARIALGPVAPTPLLAVAAAEYLLGREGGPEVLAHVAQMVVQEAHPRASLLRGGQEYRRAMVAVLVERALAHACARAIAKTQ